MLSLIIAVCNVVIGFALAIAIALIMPLLFSSQQKLGLFLVAVIAAVCTFELLMDFLGRRLWNVIFRWIGRHEAVAPPAAAYNDRPRYWVGLGLGLGAVACTIWSPTTVLNFIGSLRG